MALLQHGWLYFSAHHLARINNGLIYDTLYENNPDSPSAIAGKSIQHPTINRAIAANQCSHLGPFLGRKLYPIAKIATPKAISDCIFLIPPSQSSDCPSPPLNLPAVIKIWQFIVAEWLIVGSRYPTMPNVEVAVGCIYAKNNTVAESATSPLGYWFSVMCMPCPDKSPIPITQCEPFATGSTSSSLPKPRISQNISRKFYISGKNHSAILLSNDGNRSVK